LTLLDFYFRDRKRERKREKKREKERGKEREKCEGGKSEIFKIFLKYEIFKNSIYFLIIL